MGLNRFKRRLLASSCAALAVVGLGRTAHAQSLSADPAFDPNNVQADSFDRGVNVSVSQRPRPDYQASGLHLGSFYAYPKITTSVAYDDNIFATQKNVVSDEIFTVAPEIDLQSDWPRSGVSAYVRALQTLYVSHSSEDSTEYAGGVKGKLDVDNSAVWVGVDSGHFFIPRTVDDVGHLTKHPVQYDLTSVMGEFAHTFNRLRLSAVINYQYFGYDNATSLTGAPVLEDQLSHGDTTATAKAEYAVSPNTAVFVTAAYDTRQYKIGPPATVNSNSSGYNVGAGANFDLTHLVRGEIQLGYLDQRFVSSAFKTINGPSAKAQIEWFPTQLTTVTATAVRAVGDSGIVGSAGYLDTVGRLRIDHELRRNLILSADLGAEQDKYQGIHRIDNVYGAGFSVNWLLNRILGMTLTYVHTSQTSAGAARGPSFNDDRLTLAAVFQR